MIDLEANIFPKFDLSEADLPHIETMLENLPQLEKGLLDSPLAQSPMVTLARTEFDAGLEYSMGELDSYQFIITRRYHLHGEWHVGGANGEILNVYTFISGFKRFLEDQLALRDSGS